MDKKIDKIVLPNIKFSSARARVQTAMTNFFTRCEIKYHTKSKLGNKMDTVFGIQENKNQINQVDIDTRLIRLIECLYRDTGNQMWDFYTKLIPSEKEPKKSKENKKSTEIR